MPFAGAIEVFSGFLTATVSFLVFLTSMGFISFFISETDFVTAGFAAVFGLDSFVPGAFTAFRGFLISGFFTVFVLLSVMFFFAEDFAVLAEDLDVVLRLFYNHMSPLKQFYQIFSKKIIFF